jgi:general secretion pathway protein B
VSILLDALKKSEEQRRLGSAPTIHSEVAVDGRQSPAWRRRVVWLSVGALALLVAWLARGPLSPDPGEAAAPAVSGQRTGALPPAEGNKAPAGPESPTGARTAVESFASGEAAAATADPGVAGEGAESASQRRAELERSFRQFRAPPPETASTADVAAQVSGIPDAEPEPAPAAPSAAVVADRSPSEAGGRTEPAKRRVPEPITYWELPQSVRDGLPELKISVLVYADEPDDRFLLVNGRRMVEKDSLPGGVELEEIRRNGAVFRYRNYRFIVRG